MKTYDFPIVSQTLGLFLGELFLFPLLEVGIGHHLQGTAHLVVAESAKLRAGDIEQTANFLEQLERGGEASIAKLSLANSQVQKMAATEH